MSSLIVAEEDGQQDLFTIATQQVGDGPFARQAIADELAFFYQLCLATGADLVNKARSSVADAVGAAARTEGLGRTPFFSSFFRMIAEQRFGDREDTLFAWTAAAREVISRVKGLSSQSMLRQLISTKSGPGAPAPVEVLAGLAVRLIKAAAWCEIANSQVMLQAPDITDGRGGAGAERHVASIPFARTDHLLEARKVKEGDHVLPLFPRVVSRSTTTPASPSPGPCAERVKRLVIGMDVIPPPPVRASPPAAAAVSSAVGPAPSPSAASLEQEQQRKSTPKESAPEQQRQQQPSGQQQQQKQVGPELVGAPSGGGGGGGADGRPSAPPANEQLRQQQGMGPQQQPIQLQGPQQQQQQQQPGAQLQQATGPQRSGQQQGLQGQQLQQQQAGEAGQPRSPVISTYIAGNSSPSGGGGAGGQGPGPAPQPTQREREVFDATDASRRQQEIAADEERRRKDIASEALARQLYERELREQRARESQASSGWLSRFQGRQ